MPLSPNEPPLRTRSEQSPLVQADPSLGVAVGWVPAILHPFGRVPRGVVGSRGDSNLRRLRFARYSSPVPKEFHATTLDNPLLPKRALKESLEDWNARRARFHEDLRNDNDPLVYAQEYLAEFVDWSGVAFFNREKLLVENQPLPLPARCDAVFAVIDTASKTGTDNDATAVTFFAYDTIGNISLFILDWDIVQIEGALLETWLPAVFKVLEELARLCRARRGSLGAFIEDKNSGTILLQQALRRQMSARAIDSKLTTMGKDERAISVSGYVHRGLVKYTGRAFEKTVIYKGRSRNHLVNQVESFRVGDRGSDREDDLLDTFCYESRWLSGIAKVSNSSRLSNDRRALCG
jgi:hypothetical protein